jgi:hypothetical protein
MNVWKHTLLGAFVLTVSSQVNAQSTVLTSPSEFSGFETLIDFEGVPDGTAISNDYVGDGVSFILTDGRAPVIKYDADSRQYGPGGAGALENVLPGESSPHADIIVTFNHHVNRVAMEIRTEDTDDLSLEIRAICSGQVVATETFTTGQVYTFVGLQTDVFFDQLQIDVETNGSARIDNLRFEDSSVAEITVFNDLTPFSGNETVIDFEGHLSGTLIDNQYVADGVTFLLADGTRPRIVANETEPRQFGPGGLNALDNVVTLPNAVPPFADLRLTFAEAQNLIGFELRNADGDILTVTLTYVCHNQCIAQETFTTGLAFTFVGMQSDMGFDEVLIDVSEDVLAGWRIDNLRFEPTQRPEPPELNSPNQFSGGETVIDFEGFTGGTLIDDEYAFLGVNFSLDGGLAPKINANLASAREFGPVGNGALENFPPGAPFPFPGLNITFDDPMTRVGFELRTSNADDTIFELICTCDGGVVGSQLVDSGQAFQFVAVEGLAPFDAIRLEATGANIGAIQIDNLRFENDADTVPPLVTITSPADGAILSAPSINIAADIVDANSTRMLSTPPGICPTLPEGGGSVTGTVYLVEGPNTIVVTATDDAGNTGGTSIEVILDTTAPAIASVAPAPGTVLGNTPGAVSVDVFDATDVVVSIGGIDTALAAPGGIVNVNVALVEGSNSVPISIVDAAGNTATSSVDIVLDLSAPLVSLDAPLDGACFGPGEATIAVVVTVDDLTATQISSDPVGVTGSLPAGGGIVTSSLTLTEGWNDITVSASDTTLRRSSRSAVVLLDTTAPTLSISSPLDSDSVSGYVDFDALSLDVSPGSGVTSVDFLVNGSVIGTVTEAPYEFDYDSTLIADGTHTFAVTSVDAKGNSASASIMVLVDNTAPVISITNLVPGSFVSGDLGIDVDASDSGSGLSSVQVLSGMGAPSTDPSRTFATATPSYFGSGAEDTALHPDGPLTFTAIATDAAGNETVVSVEVLVDNVAPDKTLITPVDGDRVCGVIDITAESSAPDLASIDLLVDGVVIGSSSTSPFTVQFDTGTRFDGQMEVSVVTYDFAGNSSTCSATVTVNSAWVKIVPRSLNLKRKRRCGRYVMAFVWSPQVAIYGSALANGHNVEIHIPGGNPVPALSSFSCWGFVIYRFDRKAVVNSMNSGIASGQIRKRRRVKIPLVIDSEFVIGRSRVKPH